MSTSLNQAEPYMQSCIGICSLTGRKGVASQEET